MVSIGTQLLFASANNISNFQYAGNNSSGDSRVLTVDISGQTNRLSQGLASLVH